MGWDPSETDHEAMVNDLTKFHPDNVGHCGGYGTVFDNHQAFGRPGSHRKPTPTEYKSKMKRSDYTVPIKGRTMSMSSLASSASSSSSSTGRGRGARREKRQELIKEPGGANSVTHDIEQTVKENEGASFDSGIESTEVVRPKTYADSLMGVADLLSGPGRPNRQWPLPPPPARPRVDQNSVPEPGGKKKKKGKGRAK
jgi:hypothetical protein